MKDFTGWIYRETECHYRKNCKNIKRRLDVNQRRRSISVQLYQLVRRGVQSQDTHHSTEDLYAAAQSQEEAMTLLEEVTNSQETPKRMNRKERIK